MASSIKLDTMPISYKTMADNLWIYFENNVYVTDDDDEETITESLDKIDAFRKWMLALDSYDFASISGIDIIAHNLEMYILKNLDKCEDELLDKKADETCMPELFK